MMPTKTIRARSFRARSSSVGRKKTTQKNGSTTRTAGRPVRSMPRKCRKTKDARIQRICSMPRVHNGSVIITREPCPFDGNPAILMHLPEAKGLKIWFTLEEAESVADCIIDQVRKTEEDSAPKNQT